MKRMILLALVACGTSASPASPPPPAKPDPVPEPAPKWPVPDGWRREQFRFPLEFAPELEHAGSEELRFPPGFLDEKSPNLWAYAFEWDVTDAADLDSEALAAELTLYFRGLLVSVDGDKKRFDPAAITVTAERQGGVFVIRAHVFDAFNSAKPIDLEGTALRHACAQNRIVWRFAFAPPGSPMRAAVDELAARAPCS